MKVKNFKIEINDVNNIRDLLQTAYQLAEEQIIQAQNEINKLANATKLQEETIDGKAKYAKAINDYLGMKDKAISKKIDIAKILSEIYHHNGDTKALKDNNTMESFDFENIKKLVDESYQETETTKKIQLDKR